MRSKINQPLKTPISYYSLCQSREGVHLMAFWFTTMEGHSQFTSLDFQPWLESTSATYELINLKWAHLLAMKGAHAHV